MPPLLVPGSDELSAPAYLGTEADTAELARWKREHPDWFVAGTWEAPRGFETGRPGQTVGGAGVAGGAGGRLSPSTVMRVASTGFSASAAPRGVGRAVFLGGRSALRGGAGSRAIPVQFEPDPPERRAPGDTLQTPEEEFRELRFSEALRLIQRLEPHNPELTYLRDPDRAPPEETVRRLEHEAQMARQRNVVIEGRVLPIVPPERAANERDGAELFPPTPKTTQEIMAPRGRPIGVRLKGAGEGVQTVSPEEFHRLLEEMMIGAREVSNEKYDGKRYIRPDGTEFGVRMSKKNGETLDVNDPLLFPGFRIHQKH